MKRLNPYRIAALTFVVVGTMLLMLIGKQHMLIIENKPYKIGDVSIEAFDTVMVKVSKGEDLEIYEDDYDYLNTVGPFFTLAIEIPGENGAEGIKLNKKLYMGYADRMKVNIPQLVHEAGIR